MSKITETLELAKTVLEQNTQADVEFGEAVELESQHTVLRVPIIQGQGLPESIVIKRVPEDIEYGAQKRALSEWAGLEFLAKVANSRQFAPRFLGGNAGKLLIVLEDMGNVPTLNRILHESDSASARQALVDYGIFLGTLQGVTYGHETEFKQIQSQLNAEVPPSDSSIDLRGLLEQFREAFGPVTADYAGLEKEIINASAAMHDEQIFRTFQHHDAGPHNVLVTESGLRFIDFELAQYGNAFLDMTALRLAFPPFSQGHFLPKAVVIDYENSYRETLSKVIPEILDDSLYSLTLEQACAKWIGSKVTSFGGLFYPIIVCNELDKLPHPEMAKKIPEIRSLCHTWITAYLQWFGEKPLLPHTRDTLQQIVDEIKQRNHEVEAAGMYGAFVSYP